MYRKNYFWPLLLLCIISLFLFLGETSFHTRGEPREAVVALTMLKDGNWILPVNNGIDMAYKPPFFHWIIAAVSTVAGTINEYTSRMPSALALTAMVLVGYFFYAKRRGHELSFLTALITLTNFEVHRAGTNCRVDMVLTAMMVIALYQLYKWIEHGMKGVPFWAVLCLSGAALTKGPVGIVLPCMVPAVYLLLRGWNFWRVFFSFLMVAVLSCILPLVWYYAAYQQGGDKFLELVIEENFLRFMGKMTYESHINPAYYNVYMLLAGYVPYTLLVLISLFCLTYRKLTWSPKMWWSRLVVTIRTMDDARLYSLLSIVIIFVFYCIPKSKRSVYLLPIYPFIAYFLAEYLIYLRHRHLNAVRWFGSIMAGLAVVLTVLFAVLRSEVFPLQEIHGISQFVQALVEVPLNVWNVILVLVPAAAAVWYFKVQKLNAGESVFKTIATTRKMGVDVLGVDWGIMRSGKDRNDTTYTVTNLGASQFDYNPDQHGALFDVEAEYQPPTVEEMKSIVEGAGGNWDALIVPPALVYPSLQEALAHKMPNGKYKDQTFQQIWDADKSPRGFIAYLALKSERQNDEKAAAQVIYARLGGANIPGVPMSDNTGKQTPPVQTQKPANTQPTQNSQTTPAMNKPISDDRKAKIDKANSIFSTNEKYIKGGFQLIISDMQKYGNGKSNIQDFTDAELDALIEGIQK